MPSPTVTNARAPHGRYLSIEPGFTLLDFDRASRREGYIDGVLRVRYLPA